MINEVGVIMRVKKILVKICEQSNQKDMGGLVWEPDAGL